MKASLKIWVGLDFVISEILMVIGGQKDEI